MFGRVLHLSGICKMQIKGEIDGGERVDIFPERGIVNVCMTDDYALDENQVATLLVETGVTVRRIESIRLVPVAPEIRRIPYEEFACVDDRCTGL